MYDMYPWDTRQQDPAATGDQDDLDPATAAVQVALDRRDNGGAAGGQAPPAANAQAPTPAPVLTRQ